MAAARVAFHLHSPGIVRWPQFDFILQVLPELSEYHIGE
jgi:hypothetical protein